MIARLIILFPTIYPRIVDQRGRLFAVNRAFIRAPARPRARFSATRDATFRLCCVVVVVDLEDVERK